MEQYDPGIRIWLEIFLFLTRGGRKDTKRYCAGKNNNPRNNFTWITYPNCHLDGLPALPFCCCLMWTKKGIM